MPKIAFLINSFSSGGAEKVLTTLIQELSRQHIALAVICLEKNFFYDLPDNIKITCLSDFDGREKSIKKLIYIVVFAWRLKQYVKRQNISLVQSHLYRSNYVNILAKILGSAHEVQVVNSGTMSKYKNEGLLGKINLFLIKRLYPKAHLIILKSLGMQHDMQKLFNFTCKSTVLNNPYDIEKIERLKTEEVGSFNFKKEKKYLISVGRFETFKRQDFIIRSMRQLSLKEDVELILIGDGVKKDALVELSEKMGMADRVHFLGRVKNPYKYIARSDVYVLSSENGEGFPNVLVESMICRTPVVSSDCLSGPREILAPNTDVGFQLKRGVEKAQYGILFPVGDIDGLSKAVSFLLENEALRETYRVKAYERAHDFSVKKIVEQYKKVLNV